MRSNSRFRILGLVRCDFKPRWGCTTTHPSEMAEIGAAVSSEACESCGTDLGCFGVRSRFDAVSPVELSQCTPCEPDFGEVVPELRWEVRRLSFRLDPLDWTVVLRELVCVWSLSILRSCHSRPSSMRSRGGKEGLNGPSRPQDGSVFSSWPCSKSGLVDRLLLLLQGWVTNA